MTYMLDTNICIYAMKKKPEKVLHRFREELDGGLCISSITLAELEYGMKHSSDPVKNEQALLRFLAPLSILPFGAGAASEYGEIRAYLRGESLEAEEEGRRGKGWALVLAGGYPLGWGKLAGGMLKNHYPKGLRVSI